MNLETIPYFGEILALSAAIVWAFAVILFKKSGEKVHPLGLNLFKNVMAFVLFIPTLWFAGEQFFLPASSQEYLILLLSGALGIGIADTLFFGCLNRLGAGLTAIVDCFYSPSMIILSFMFLGDNLTFIQIVGVALILSALLTALHRKASAHLNRKDVIIGVLYGAMAMLLMAIGVVIAKPILDAKPFFWVTEVRLIGGLLVLIPIFYFHPKKKEMIASLKASEGKFNLWAGSFIGAYLAMIFWLGGMKYAQVSTSAALNQTNNVFIFILAAIFLKEKLNRFKIIGIILAVSGALLVTFGVK